MNRILIAFIFISVNTFAQMILDAPLTPKEAKKFERKNKGRKGFHTYVGWRNGVEPVIPITDSVEAVSYVRFDKFPVGPQVDYYFVNDTSRSIACSWINRSNFGRVYSRLSFDKNYLESRKAEDLVWENKYEHIYELFENSIGKPGQSNSNFEVKEKGNFSWKQKKAKWQKESECVTLILYVYEEQTNINGSIFNLPTYGLWVVREFDSKFKVEK